ncbi:MAG: 3'(2'),5'-bisphosphate nucleotidase CysQ [Pseudomonadota bacterium]
MTSIAETMVKAAVEASGAILDIYRSGAKAQTKGDGSPVTLADERGEEIILKHLKENHPDIPVLAEESVAAGDIPEIGDTFFLVDPLDGTKEFVSGTDEFTVNIALIKDGVPIIGVVTTPAIGGVYVGEIGQGASLQAYDFDKGEPTGELQTISVRTKPQTGAVAMTSRSHGSPETQKMLERLGVTDVLPAGSSLKFCAIAEGRADLYPRLGRTMEWDTGAAHAVLKAAGGEVYVFDDQERGAPLAYGKTARGYDNPHFLAVGGEM